MAELSLTIPSNNTGGGAASNTTIFKRVLIRTSGPFPANASVNVNSPGPGWVSSGDLVTITGASSLMESTQIYRGGQLLLTGEDASTDNDVYFTGSNSVAFEFPITKNEVFQIWQFVTASG